MVNETFAQMSNLLVYSAMSVYALALIAFCVDLAGRSKVVGEVAAAQQATADSAQGHRSAGQAGQDGGGVATAERTEAELVGPRSRWLGVAVALTWLAAALHLGAVVTRGLSVTRVPWANMYEFALTGSLVVSLVYLGLTRWRSYLRTFGLFIVGPVLLTLGLAMTVLYTQAAQLVPALQSPFLVIHVSIAFVSCALFGVAFAVQVVQLIQDRRERRAATGATPLGAAFDRLPSAGLLDRLGYRIVAISFPLWTFTLVAGAIWAEQAWGRYWGWDPKEVWTFVVWTIYAAYLHARATRGWDGRRATIISMLGFAGVIINFTVVNVIFTGQHSYAGIG